MTARLARIALIVGLVIATSGLGRGTVVLADDGCCADGDEHDASAEDESDDSSQQGCPLPCSDCVCAAYLAPAVLAQGAIAIASAPGAAAHILRRDLDPEARFLPGVFRPPRHAA